MRRGAIWVRSTGPCLAVGSSRARMPSKPSVREVNEEVGLNATQVAYLFDFPYPSGWTSCFRVHVEPGEPALGQDSDLKCECPRMVGLDWIPFGPGGDSGRAIPVMFLAGQVE